MSNNFSVNEIETFLFVCLFVHEPKDPPKAPSFRVDNVSTHEAVLSWDYGTSQMQTSSSEAGGGGGPLLVDGYVISYHVSSVRQHDNHLGLLDFIESIGTNSGSTSSSSSSSSSTSTNMNNDDWQSVTISSPSTSSFTIRNLRCGTEYIGRIEAFNEMGSGRPSELLRFSTLGNGMLNNLFCCVIYFHWLINQQNV